MANRDFVQPGWKYYLIDNFPRYPLSKRIFLTVGQKKDVCLQSGLASF